MTSSEPVAAPAPAEVVLASDKLVPLLCSGCGAAVPLVDAEATTCPHCGASVDVPAAYRSAVSLVRLSDVEAAEAEAAWQRFDRATLPRWVVVSAASLPPAGFLFGLVASVAVALGGVATGEALRTFVLRAMWLPMLGLTCVSLIVSAFCASAKHGRPARIALAAVERDHVPTCRVCGAPLTLRAGQLFSRCVYCHADNLLEPDAMARRALEKDVAAVEASALDAARATSARVANAWSGIPGSLVVFAFAFAVPTLWSLAGSPWGPGASALATLLAGAGFMVVSVLSLATNSPTSDPPQGGIMLVIALTLFVVLPLFWYVAATAGGFPVLEGA